MVLKNKVSLMSLHQWTYGPLMINILSTLLSSPQFSSTLFYSPLLTLT